MTAEDFAKKILDMATECGVSADDVCRAADAVRVYYPNSCTRRMNFERL